MMKQVDVYELARTTRTEEGSVPVRALTRLAAALVDDAGVLVYGLRGFTDERGRPAACLVLDGAVTLTCDHCGKPASFPLGVRSRFYFVADERELDQIAVDEADEEPLVGSRRFDLAALIEDEAILALPISPRHRACQAAVDHTPRPEVARQSAFAALAVLRKPRT